MTRFILSLSLLLSACPLIGCAADLCDGNNCQGDPDGGDDASLVTVGTLTREAVFIAVPNGWAKVERWRDPNPGIQQEDFPPSGKGNQDGQRLTFFGNSQPNSNRFLLYYAPGATTNPKAVPVLLVHGANDNADRAWANPNEL